MSPEMVVDVFRQAIYITMIMMVVLIVPGLIVGLLVAMFQAATQINEMSLSFIPKLLVTLMVMSMTGPWLLKTIIGFSKRLILDIPYLIG